MTHAGSHGTSHQQDIDQYVLKLLQKACQRTAGSWWIESVRTVLGQALFYFRRTQPLFMAGEELENRARLRGVPVGCCCVRSIFFLGA